MLLIWIINFSYCAQTPYSRLSAYALLQEMSLFLKRKSFRFLSLAEQLLAICNFF